MLRCSPSDSDVYRNLLAKVGGAPQFRKSPRQKQLLLYLANRVLDEPTCEIHEQEIGSVVFGRAADYDTSTDNIVRVNIYELRKRLQAYFSGDGADEPIVIEIPKGSYCPVFTRRNIADISKKTEEEDSPVQPPQIRTRFIWPAIVALLAAACVWLAIRNASLNRKVAGTAPPPALERLWSRMFTEGRATDVVIADSNFSLLQDLLRRSVAANDYFNKRYLTPSTAATLNASDRRAMEILMSRRYTSTADVHVLRRILLLNGPKSSRIDVYFARDFSPEDLKISDVVLLGSRRSNPWAAFFEDELNFRFEADEKTGYELVINKHPKPGERQRYETTEQPPMIESYGVVAFVPNLAGTGNVLLLEGAGMHATQSAGEIVTEEPLWKQVLQAIGATAGKPLPWFEVLFRVRVMGATMQSPRVVSVRTVH